MTSKQRTLVGVGFLFLLLALIPLQAAELTPLPLEERVARIEAAQSGIDSGDNTWMLVSSALVLMMSAPGLILFYGGLVRKKNVLATMMHTLFLMAFISVLWMLYGYSMAFAEGNAFFGNPMQYFLLQGVGGAPNTDYAATIPHQSFMLFQMMFAIITPALITGAFAERLKFNAFVPSFISRSRTWSGARAVTSTGRWAGKCRCWISPAESWCTSARAWLRWCARRWSASGSAFRVNRFFPTTWCTA
jgi:hypothetical protein